MTMRSCIRRASHVGLALVASVAGAQSTSADTLHSCRGGEARAQLLFVGTFHFANERIVVIYGSGHLATRQQFAKGSPEYDLVLLGSVFNAR